MKKKVKIEGMSCGHCAMRVKDALEQVEGVSSAKVNHKKGNAVISMEQDIAVGTLKAAVDETGYVLVGDEG